MEVALLVVAVIGIAMLVAPRVRRRRSARAPVRRAAMVSAPAATWRPPADDDGWDDDLGWEGAEPEPAAPAAGAPAPAADGDGPVTRTWSGSGRATEVRPEPVTAAERADWLDEDWEQPDGCSWSGRAAEPAVVSAPRRRRLHPVALVAIYAAAGIGVIVLASTVLLGGSSPTRPRPAKQIVAPKATPTAIPTQATGTVTDDTANGGGNDAEAAAARAQKKAHDAFTRERARAMAEERRELAAARRAQARKRAAAARQKAAAIRKNAATRPKVTAPQATPVPTYTYTPPKQTYTPPARRGGGSRGGGGCEFCIG